MTERTLADIARDFSALNAELDRLVKAKAQPPAPIHHVRTGPGKCACGFDAYKIRGIMLDYSELLSAHLRSHR